MMTHLWTRHSKRLITLLAAIALMGMSACGDDADKNTDENNDADKCADVTCAQPEATCDGNTAVTYTDVGICNGEDGTCDYSAVEERTNCEDSAQECRDGACVSVTDVCENIACEAPADSCEGNTAITYTGAGTCDPSDLSCDFTGVKVVTNCEDSGQECQQGACVTVEQPESCDDVTCDQPADTCDGNTVVSYSGDGVCDDSDFTCDYSGVETRTDCEAGEICDAGACVAQTGDHSVNAGDLVITEFLADPTTVGDDLGEYFEVYNTTNRTLHLNGLTIADNDGDAFVVTHPDGDPIAVAPQSYFVFGASADTALNGGIPVDYAFVQGTDMTLANSGDEIVIFRDKDSADEVEIARVEYGSGTDFPSKSAGVSSQLGSEHGFDAIDNNDGSLWCHSREKISATNDDLGSPGAANGECAIPTATVTIQDLQDDSSTDHPAPGTPVRVENATITFVSANDAWAQDPAGGQYSGVYLKVSGVDVSGVSVGDVVNIEGTYTETYGVTTIDNPTITVNASGAALSPEVVSSSVFADSATAEPWEGVLVKIAKPGVTHANPDGPANDYGEFRVDATLRVDDQLFDYATGVSKPTVCDTFGELAGVLHFSHGNYKLLPRDAADFPAPGALDLSTDNAVEVSAVGISPAAICVSAGSAVTWTVSSGGAIELTEVDPSTGAKLTSPGFSGIAGSFGGFRYTFNDAGITHYMGETGTGSSIGQGRVIVAEP